ncbi:MAG: fructosamine kinase family protein [Gammaproteobacteria bacterium]|nr:fructosamine kinase family protein [Gammaproteobacteria bacterium]
MSFWDQIGEEIGKAGSGAFSPAACETVTGGCISSAYRLTCTSGDAYFIKTHDAAQLDMFAAEAQGLREMAASKSIRVPTVITWGVIGQQSYLVMEYLSLRSRGEDPELGRELAMMHRYQRGVFGWDQNNTIGSSPQDNSPCEDWIEFWRSRRLGAQLTMAANNGYDGRLQEKGFLLLEGLDCLFRGYSPLPSLLHGDLWSGNYGFTPDGQPVLFDPACYYGDRETDLAMTELFGGFGQGFYTAYNETWPLDPGYSVRKLLYNLYHILNHLNLFGISYADQAEQMVDRLLSEIQ